MTNIDLMNMPRGSHKILGRLTIIKELDQTFSIRRNGDPLLFTDEDGIERVAAGLGWGECNCQWIADIIENAILVLDAEQDRMKEQVKTESAKIKKSISLIHQLLKNIACYGCGRLGVRDYGEEREYLCEGCWIDP